MNKEELILAEEAREYVKQNKHKLIDRFADPKIYSVQTNPTSIFMAGSPGAGKTEFSKRLLEGLNKPVVRIDPDEIRQMLPGYNGSNSYLFQLACSLGVDRLLHFCLENKQDFLLDGIFSNYEKSLNNLERCVKAKRKIQIFYVYQEPTIAWDFTQKREHLEQRHIPREAFIRGFINSRANVERAKLHFKDKIQLHLVIKSYKNTIEDFWPNIEKIDNHLPNKYTEAILQTLI